VPSLLCLLLYWKGLNVWFQQDDFAWLGLHLQVHDWPTFLHAVFTPMAQGTIRPLSERLFYMGFYKLFGMNALPFRLFVFLTQFSNLVLICAIVRRLTRSNLAGFLAPVLWMVNSSLSVAMSWTAAYNQIQCAFWMLLAFYWFIVYTQTGEKRYYLWQGAAFVLGFGALEINVVYPALVAIYALCFARRHLIRTVPLFIVSAAYALLHRSIAPAQTTDVYRMYFDSSLLWTFFTYCKWATGVDRLVIALMRPAWPFIAMECVVIACLLMVVLVKGKPALLFIGWFVIVLAPLLPLRNHISNYYLTVPTIGLAMLGAWGISSAWERGRGAGIAASVVALLYAVPMIWDTRMESRFNYLASTQVKALVLGVQSVHQANPGKMILLTGISDRLFLTGIYDDPFRVLGIPNVFVAGKTSPDDVTGALVYEYSNYHLKDVTAAYFQGVVK
jgi:hypothetical protein